MLRLGEESQRKDGQRCPVPRWSQGGVSVYGLGRSRSRCMEASGQAVLDYPRPGWVGSVHCGQAASLKVKPEAE